MTGEPLLLVVTGPPAAGKSTLARWLASRLGWPLLVKDDFKERLLGSSVPADREESRRLSDLAWELLFEEAGRVAARRAPLILEGNFRPAGHPARLAALAADHGLRLVQVHCGPPAGIRTARLRARVGHGRRHPGHLDAQLLGELEAAAEAGADAQPLALDAPLIRHLATSRGSATISAARRTLLAGIEALSRQG